MNCFIIVTILKKQLGVDTHMKTTKHTTKTLLSILVQQVSPHAVEGGELSKPLEDLKMQGLISDTEYNFILKSLKKPTH